MCYATSNCQSRSSKEKQNKKTVQDMVTFEELYQCQWMHRGWAEEALHKNDRREVEASIGKREKEDEARRGLKFSVTGGN